MICLTAMMFLTAVDVILRRSINKPITGSYELIQFMMVITVALAVAYAAIEKGHVTIDIITVHLPKRTRVIIDILVGVLGLGIAIIMTWQAGLYIVTLRQSHLLSTVLLAPMYPFVAVVAFGLGFFCLVLVAHILEFALLGKQE